MTNYLFTGKTSSLTHHCNFFVVAMCIFMFVLIRRAEKTVQMSLSHMLVHSHSPCTFCIMCRLRRQFGYNIKFIISKIYLNIYIYCFGLYQIDSCLYCREHYLLLHIALMSHCLLFLRLLFFLFPAQIKIFKFKDTQCQFNRVPRS